MAAKAFYDEWIVVFNNHPQHGDVMTDSNNRMIIFPSRQAAKQALQGHNLECRAIIIGLGPMGGE